MGARTVCVLALASALAGAGCGGEVKAGPALCAAARIGCAVADRVCSGGGESPPAEVAP